MYVLRIESLWRGWICIYTMSWSIQVSECFPFENIWSLYTRFNVEYILKTFLFTSSHHLGNSFRLSYAYVLLHPRAIVFFMQSDHWIVYWFIAYNKYYVVQYNLFYLTVLFDLPWLNLCYKVAHSDYNDIRSVSVSIILITPRGEGGGVEILYIILNEFERRRLLKLLAHGM